MISFFYLVFLQQEKQYLTLTNSLQIHSVNDADVNDRGTPTLDQLVDPLLLKTPWKTVKKSLSFQKNKVSLVTRSAVRVRRDARVLECLFSPARLCDAPNPTGALPHPGNSETPECGKVK